MDARASIAPTGAADWTTPPGGLLVWLVVLLELLTFAIGLTAFVLRGRAVPAEFAAGRAGLHQGLALTNTLVLLTGGWCMANGLASLRRAAPQRAGAWIAAASATAVLFLVLKACEYADLLRHGHGLRSDSFHTYYWLLTGFHGLHVLGALCILAALGWGMRRGRYTALDHDDVEAGGVFWHLCDAIWLVLFPLIYLLP